ncbi:MAG: hemerythrin HHE cation-binding protein [Planctomycetota bacterium]|nr:MAG: hemerythrin HHE cation-binding protein [Planctomycetota bacterium]
MEQSLNQFFLEDHRRCDRAWADLEAAIDEGASEAVQPAWEFFAAAMERHFQMEERVLFPAFESRTGMIQGPTQVMRAEHDQMRGVLSQMSSSLASGDLETVLELGDTLLILAQQHNMKEEAVLYPMAEQHLHGDWEELYSRCQELD